MTNIINFPLPDREHISYTEIPEIGMIVQDAELDVMVGFDGCSPDTLFISVDGEYIHTDRKRLAEFLWCAVRMIDSEGRYEFDVYPARNYE